MGPADEADLLIVKLRQLGEKFRGFTEMNWSQIKSQDEAGRLIMRASDLGLLPGVDGLPELVAWAKSPEPPLGGRQSQLAHCPTNVFGRLAGYDQIEGIAVQDANGVKTIHPTRGDGGGILPTAFPETLPAYPPTAQMSDRKRAEHYAEVCDMMVRRIEKAAETLPAEGGDTPAAKILELFPEQFKNFPALKRYLQDHPEIPRQTKGQRTRVDVGSLAQTLAAESSTGSPTEADIDAYVQGVQKRKREIDRKKTRGK